VRMVADMTETRNVIPSLEFKTCMTINIQIWFAAICKKTAFVMQQPTYYHIILVPAPNFRSTSLN